MSATLTTTVMEASHTSTLGRFLGTARKPKFKSLWPNPQESTGYHYSGIKLGGKLCWEATGLAREKFAVLAIEIKIYLTTQSDPVESPVTWTLYMIGKTRQSSRPTVMFCSENKSARKVVRERIINSGLLEKYPGFETGGLGEEFRRLATENSGENVYTGPFKEEKCILYSRSDVGPGMLVYINGYTGGKSTLRKARCGGIMYHQGTYFLQTVAHAFTEFSRNSQLRPNPGRSCDFEFELEDHDDSSPEDVGEDENIENTSCGSATPERLQPDDTEEHINTLSAVSSTSSDSNTIENNTLDMPRNSELLTNDTDTSLDPKYRNDLSITLSKLGNKIFLSTDGTQRDLDYCLIEIQQSEVMYFASYLKSCLSFLPHVTAKEPKNIEVTINGVETVWTANLSGTPTFIMLPDAASIQEVWTVNHGGELADGDCGAWVTDMSMKELYGHIVASNPRSCLAYIIPSYMVFDDIQLRFDIDCRFALQNSTSDSLGKPDTIPKAYSAEFQTYRGYDGDMIPTESQFHPEISTHELHEASSKGGSRTSNSYAAGPPRQTQIQTEVPGINTSAVPQSSVIEARSFESSHIKPSSNAQD